jgi:hypothetical protein
LIRHSSLRTPSEANVRTHRSRQVSGHTLRTASKRGHGESVYVTKTPTAVSGQSALVVAVLVAEQLRLFAPVKQPVGSAIPPLKHGGVGLADGDAVGAIVGAPVDGADVGVCEGAGVGACVHELQNTRQVAATEGLVHATSGPSTLLQPAGSGASNPSNT